MQKDQVEFSFRAKAWMLTNLSDNITEFSKIHVWGTKHKGLIIVHCTCNKNIELHETKKHSKTEVKKTEKNMSLSKDIPKSV